MFRRLKARRIRTTCSTYTMGQNCTEFKLLITPTIRFHLGDLDVHGDKKIADFATKKMQMVKQIAFESNIKPSINVYRLHLAF
jgi:hypothetical protein